MKKSKSSIFLLLLGLLGLCMLVVHSIRFERIAMGNIELYVPTCTNNTLGGYNFYFYFTFQSNIFVNIYLVLLGLRGLGVNKVKRIVENPYIQGMITIYILITGLVYCFILFPHLEYYPWDGDMGYANIVNLYNHIATPLIMLVLWFKPISNKKLDRKFIYLSLIYPASYFIFSIIRGAIVKWYPYPFCNPKLLWESLIKDVVYNQTQGIILFVGFLLFMILLFVGTSNGIRYIRNKMISKKEYVIAK